MSTSSLRPRFQIAKTTAATNGQPPTLPPGAQLILNEGRERVDHLRELIIGLRLALQAVKAEREKHGDYAPEVPGCLASLNTSKKMRGWWAKPIRIRNSWRPGAWAGTPT
jgi:hypothetical protein